MLCPQCCTERCHRSKRRGIKDYAIGLTGLRPWRCRMCNKRFFARSVALSYALTAHCRECGNLDLQRISRDHMKGFRAWFLRRLHVPVYRCDPCRNRFFSWRRYRPVRPVAAKEAPPEAREDSHIASV